MPTCVSLTSNKIKLTMSRAVIIPYMESSIRMKSEPKYCSDTIQEPMTALLDFNQPMTVFNEPFAVCDITKAVSSFMFYDSFLLLPLPTFSRLF